MAMILLKVRYQNCEWVGAWEHSDRNPAMMLDRTPNREHRSQPELFTGISVYNTEEAARGTARAFTVLGGWIAVLDVVALQRTNKFIIRQTRAVEHYTLWGMPKVFIPAIMTVVTV
jgi:hypothetical protein